MATINLTASPRAIRKRVSALIHLIMYIGGHVSAAGGVLKSIERAEKIEAEVMQLFITSPRSYQKTEYSEAYCQQFKDEYNKRYFKGLYFHGIYLLNLASEQDYLWNISIDSLIYHLNTGDKLGAVGTVVHLGSWISQAPNMNRLVEAIQTILEKTPETQYFIIENAAGSPKVGATLEELSAIYHLVGNNRVKFCIDTQHLFASGIDTSDKEIFGQWLKDFNDQIGIQQIVLLHANDSKTDLGSKSDRHQNIGEGEIGYEGFRNILDQPLLQDKSFILEVPGVDNKSGPDLENINRLKKMIKE